MSYYEEHSLSHVYILWRNQHWWKLQRRDNRPSQLAAAASVAIAVIRRFSTFFFIFYSIQIKRGKPAITSQLSNWLNPESHKKKVFVDFFFFMKSVQLCGDCWLHFALRVSTCLTKDDNLLLHWSLQKALIPFENWISWPQVPPVGLWLDISIQHGNERSGCSGAWAVIICGWWDAHI